MSFDDALEAAALAIYRANRKKDVSEATYEAKWARHRFAYTVLARAAIGAVMPTDVGRLLAAVQAVTGIAELNMNSEHGDRAFVQGWEAAIEEMNARLVAALGGEA